jgi:hypothetical protein
MCRILIDDRAVAHHDRGEHRPWKLKENDAFVSGIRSARWRPTKDQLGLRGSQIRVLLRDFGARGRKGDGGAAQ